MYDRIQRMIGYRAGCQVLNTLPQCEKLSERSSIDTVHTGHRTGFCCQSGPHQPSISPHKALAGLSNMMAAWVGAGVIRESIDSSLLVSTRHTKVSDDTSFLVQKADVVLF